VLIEYNSKYLEEIKGMSSFLDMDLFFKPGQHVPKTIDLFTFGGFFWLFNVDEKQVEEDYERIRTIEKTGLFIV
jgi:hypothetical protein